MERSIFEKHATPFHEFGNMLQLALMDHEAAVEPDKKVIDTAVAALLNDISKRKEELEQQEEFLYAFNDSGEIGEVGPNLEVLKTLLTRCNEFAYAINLLHESQDEPKFDA